MIRVLFCLILEVYQVLLARQSIDLLQECFPVGSEGAVPCNELAILVALARDSVVEKLDTKLLQALSDEPLETARHVPNFLVCAFIEGVRKDANFIVFENELPIVFIDRSFAGHMGNLSRFKAAGPWREMVERYSRRAII